LTSWWIYGIILQKFRRKKRKIERRECIPVNRKKWTEFWEECKKHLRPKSEQYPHLANNVLITLIEKLKIEEMERVLEKKYKRVDEEYGTVLREMQKVAQKLAKR